MLSLRRLNTLNFIIVNTPLLVLPCYTPYVLPWYALSGELNTLNFIILNTSVLVLPCYTP